MMNVGIVQMAVGQDRVDVNVDVRLFTVPRDLMLVPVMFVVTMQMRVLRELVTVLVDMALGNVQPDAESHQARSRRQ